MNVREHSRHAGLAVMVAVAIGMICLVIGGAPAQAAPPGPNGPPTAPPLATSPPKALPLTAPRLAADLRAAALITDAPANLTPSLSDPTSWGPVIVRNGCQLSHIHDVKSKPCVYGDTKADTTVVLFGDSHAGAWFPALEQISLEQHWRLLIFTKAGCSPPEVKLYRKCTVWRRNTEAQIAAIHPAIVFVSWARWLEPKAKPEPGVATGYGGTWLDGVAAIFSFLQASAGRVIFISDVPTFDFGAARCVSTHLTDIQACNDTPRSRAIFMPKLRAEELQLASAMGVSSIDPIPWFCSPAVCPVVVGNILVYYDSSHMTPPWSSFLAPMLASAITTILADKPGTITS